MAPQHGPGFSDVIERLAIADRRRPDAPLYRFYDGKGRLQQSYTVGELVAVMRSMSGFLRGECGLEPGDTALLVYPPSLDFAVALLGCMYAGVVPAPVYPPNPFKLEQGLETFAPIAENCGARVTLTNRTYARSRRVGQVRSFVKRGPRLPDALTWISTDKVRPGQYDAARGPTTGPDDVALLQYTSGSTSAPKGVMITHGNLIHQLDFNRAQLKMGPDSHSLTWVPQYHDFGLISGILSAAAGNGLLTLFSPLDFVSDPALWLELITRHGATHTAAPNFAYELAVRKTTPAQRRRWDLSRLVVAMSAAEPVRAGTVARFCEAFAPAGFDPAAFNPAYGLAEHTVGVTVNGGGLLHLDRAALEQQRVVEVAADDPARLTLVGCGRPVGDIAVRIVDPEAAVALGERAVGEIWCDSPSKAAGYHRQPELTAETFEARLAGEATGHWLRTGDMGFLHDGELFICGRLKDMLILEGRNLYPQDVEDAARGAHPRVRPGGLAAFVIEHVGDETPDALHLYVELRGGPLEAGEGRGIAAAVHDAVRAACDVGCASVALGAPGLVRKTTSGKIRRRACKAAWIAGDRTHIWHVERFAFEPAASADPAQAAPAAPGDPALSLPDAIRRYAAELLGLGGPEAIDPRAPLFVQGLTSILAVDLCGRVGERIGRPIPVTVLFQNPSVEELAAALEAGPSAPEADAREALDAALTLDRGDRVIVIGGGPAGISAAAELVEKGARVLLLEHAPRVGGKVTSTVVDGRRYELGQLLFFPTYTRVLERISALGLDLRASQINNHSQTLDGRAEPLDNRDSTEWCRAAFALGGRPADFERALRDVPEALTLPLGEWLERMDLPPMPPGMQDLWTAFGYGHLSDDVPAIYLIAGCMMFAESHLHVAQLAGHNHDLWTAEVELMQESGALEVRTGVTVTALEGGRDGVVVRAGDRAFEAPAAVLAVPPDVARRILADEHPAQPLLAKFETYEYVVTIAEVDAPGWPNQAVLPDNLPRARAGHLMDYQRQFPDVPVLALSQYGHGPDGARIDDERLLSLLADDVAAGGGALGTVHTQRRWTYFPHLGSADLRAGTMEALHALQGRDNILLVGSYLNFEALEHTVTVSRGVVRQRVAVAGPSTLQAVLDDPVFGGLARQVLDRDAPPGPLRLGPWTVRPAEASDRDEVDRLDRQEYGWLGEDAVEGPESIAHQIALLNGGETPWLWVLEWQGEMVGWYVLQPTKKDPTAFRSWADATDGGRLTGTFDPQGKNLYLVAAGVTGEHSKAAHGLMVLNTVRLMRREGIETFFCCVSMPGFAQAHARDGIEPEAYMKGTAEDGTPLDPMMAFFRQSWPGTHRPPRFLRDGYPPDRFSGGHGVGAVVDLTEHDAGLGELLVGLLRRRGALGV